LLRCKKGDLSIDTIFSQIHLAGQYLLGGGLVSFFGTDSLLHFTSMLLLTSDKMVKFVVDNQTILHIEDTPQQYPNWNIKYDVTRFNKEAKIICI
jgi:hypothetical protein